MVWLIPYTLFFKLNKPRNHQHPMTVLHKNHFSFFGSRIFMFPAYLTSLGNDTSWYASKSFILHFSLRTINRCYQFFCAWCLTPLFQVLVIPWLIVLFKYHIVVQFYLFFRPVFQSKCVNVKTLKTTLSHVCVILKITLYLMWSLHMTLYSANSEIQRWVCNKHWFDITVWKSLV